MVITRPDPKQMSGKRYRTDDMFTKKTDDFVNTYDTNK